MNPIDIAVGLYNRYESIEEVRHYYGILAIYGLCRIADQTGSQAVLERTHQILSRFPDAVNHPRYNFPSYRIGGLARAFAFWRGIDPAASELVRTYADELMTAPRDPKGILKWPGGTEHDLIWIDVAMAATPYLLFAGLALGNQCYINQAAEQAFLMYNEFYDPETGLLHQSKNFNGAGRYSADHWSRGNGWGYIALTELVQYLPTDSVHRARAEKYFVDLSAAILNCQNSRGLWRQEMTLDTAWEESSGSALFLYGFGVGLRTGILAPEKYAAAFAHGIQGLGQYCIGKDLTTYQTCQGCLCPGNGPDKGTVHAYLTAVKAKPNDEHSWGPFMLALAEASLHGIHDLTVGS